MIVALLVIGWKEDAINGYFARRRALPGTDAADTAFYPDHFLVKTAAAESRWQYDRILALAETGTHLVFVMGKDHALGLREGGAGGAAASRNSAASWRNSPGRTFRTSEDKET